MRLLIFCLIFSTLFSYEDEELKCLWANLADICHPTVEDYRKIEFYLEKGQRLYLDPLRENAPFVNANWQRRLNNMLHFKLLGPNGELPLFEIHHLNPNEITKNRCILIFGSFNGLYPKKARRLLEELKLCGYSGDVLIRIGGFPNTQNGALKICHAPNSFKVAFFQEARTLGYKEALWVDTSMHPLSSLEKIFTKLRLCGYYFTYAGTLQDNETGHLASAAKALYIDPSQYDLITHAHSSIVGICMDHPKGRRLLDAWFAETARVHPNVTWFPEELSLSVVAWRLNLQADGWFGSLVCGDRELSFLLPIRPTLQFYCEDAR